MQFTAIRYLAFLTLLISIGCVSEESDRQNAPQTMVEKSVGNLIASLPDKSILEITHSQNSRDNSWQRVKFNVIYDGTKVDDSDIEISAAKLCYDIKLAFENMTEIASQLSTDHHIPTRHFEIQCGFVI